MSVENMQKSNKYDILFMGVNVLSKKGSLRIKVALK